ncbi:hypothetical protein [Marinobacter sp.]|uniref:hypothetical protein n=1 Tax=Marinobacter sp. TaxID=50741 RepID=UPI003A8CE125
MVNGTGAVFFNRREEKQSPARSAIIAQLFRAEAPFKANAPFTPFIQLFEGIAETSS